MQFVTRGNVDQRWDNSPGGLEGCDLGGGGSIILRLLLLGVPGARAVAVSGVSAVVRAPGLLSGRRTVSSGASVAVAGAAVTVAGATLSPVVAATTAGGSAAVLSAW